MIFTLGIIYLQNSSPEFSLEMNWRQLAQFDLTRPVLASKEKVINIFEFWDHLALQFIPKRFPWG